MPALLSGSIERVQHSSVIISIEGLSIREVGPMRVSRSQSVVEQKQEGRAWRERFVQNAVANVRLEGLEPIREALEIWQRYIEGEISVEQAGELIRALPTAF